MMFCPGGRPNFDLIFHSGKTGQISNFNRTHGKGVTAKLIFIMLEDLNNYFNVQRPMTAAQMTDLAVEMADTLWSFRLEEILTFAEAMKKGTYGNVYERLDPSIIWNKFALYQVEREEYFLISAAQHRQSDPAIVDEESDKIKGSIMNISGVLSQVSGKLREKKAKDGDREK